MPDYFDEFTIMTFGTLNGNFESITGAFVNGNMALAPDGSTTDLTLVTTLPGDGNIDGVVNFVDFALIANNFNITGTSWGEGNFNQDNITNFQDFAILSNHFMQTIPSNDAVPEPTALMLVGLGALAIIRTGTRLPRR